MIRGFPYKPELSEDKAKLFARCFAHCLESEDIELTKAEQRVLLHFCNVVGEKGFVEHALTRIEQRQEAVTVSAVEALKHELEQD